MLRSNNKKPGLCVRCRNNIADGPKMISFEHDSHTFNAFKIGSCCTECVQKEIIKRFEKYKADLFKGNSINWKYFIEKCEPSMDIREEVGSILLIIGVLSVEPLGNWGISDNGPLGMNPRIFINYSYFTQKSDAVEYAKIKYGGSNYLWIVYHVDEVILKKDIVKKS